MTPPLRSPRSLAIAMVIALATMASGVQAASAGFLVAAPGSADPSALPRELRQPPLCTEKPVYPRQAYRKDLEGLTVIRATVGKDGRIRVMTIYHSSGDTLLHREMDAAASSALGTCHWEVVSPASFDQAVDVDVHYAWKKSEHADDF